MKLIVGLGNPGREYEKSRHNVGFMCIDKICDELSISLNKNKFNGEYYQGNIKNDKVILLKPQTYMNLSGDCIIQFISYFNIDISDVLIIFDDLDTDVGKIRIRSKGSAGGQNGMKNTINHLKTDEISRIRIGIGRNKLIETKNYVLSSFSSDEKENINTSLKLASQAALDFINTDISKLMSLYNKK